MTIAFVFQGGASLSAAQVGMLRALTEAGITPDLVIGTSAGAINAVGYAQDPTEDGLDTLERLWGEVRRRDVFPLRLRPLASGLRGRKSGFMPADGLRGMMERGLRVHDLRDTVIPAHAVAADAATGEPVVLSEGSAVQAVLASASIPGVLPPVLRGGRALVDGGIAADIPILQAEQLGATESYVLPCVVGPEEQFTGGGALPAMLHAVNMMVDRITRHNLSLARGRVHVLPTPVIRNANPMDFGRSDEMIRLGLTGTRRWLAEQTAIEARRLPVPPMAQSARGVRGAW
jgi:NTE family protein